MAKKIFLIKKQKAWPHLGKKIKTTNFSTKQKHNSKRG